MVVHPRIMRRVWGHTSTKLNMADAIISDTPHFICGAQRQIGTPGDAPHVTAYSFWLLSITTVKLQHEL